MSNQIEITINKMIILGIIYVILGLVSIYFGSFFGTLEWFFIASLIFLFEYFKKKYKQLAKFELVVFVIGIIFLILPFIGGLVSLWLVSIS